MRKRLLSLLLALVMLTSMLPVTAAAAVPETDKAAIRSAVEKVLKDHAKKVYQAEADDDAFVDFFIHAFFGNHKDMILNDSSAQTAALMNSNLLQEALPNVITEGIATAMESRERELTVTGSLAWYSFRYSYSFSAYRGDAAYNKRYNSDEGFDYSTRLKSLGDTKTYHGVNDWPGSKNAYDEVQELLSGSAWVKVLVREVETKKDTKVYELKLKIHDDFDFEGDYNDIAKKGYDVSKDQRLKRMGLLFTTLGIDEFFWEYIKTFQVEVPYHCDHETGSYHWTYDNPTLTLTPDGSGEFDVNNVNRRVYQYKTKDENGVEITKDRIYYGLEDTVVLSHNKPWVIEWDWQRAPSLQMSPYRSSANCLPNFYFYSRYYIWLYYQEVVKLPDGQKTEEGNTTETHTHYVGTKITDEFQYNSKHTYTYILENVVNADGSNMIYASVYNKDLDEVVFGPVPMDDHWVKKPKDEERTLLSESDNTLSGRDFYINYIGNTGLGVTSTGEMDLRIYENGKNAAVKTSLTSKKTSSTCTKQGGTTYTCADCGYSYVTDAIPALGHSYGEYVSDNNATCTENGTQTRICTRCGVKDTATVPNTALGHDFGEYLYNKDASCTEDGTQSRNCSRCTAAETKDAPDTATGHSHQPCAVTTPTCTAQGYTTYTCHCGDSYKADYVDATGHNYQMTIVAPTCTEQGYTVYTCHCGDTYKADYTDETGHSPVIDAAVPASCIGNGLTEGSHCEVCGYVIKAQNTVIGGTHLKDEGTVIKEATYETPGTVMYQCIYCGEKSYVVLPKLDKPEPVVNPFTDVKESDWFYNPVMWAVQSGVTGGKTATTFAPNEGCTRAQVVTFLWAANGKPMPKSAENPFTDIKEGDWYYNAVLWAVENGITGGISADKFGPNATCTRAQIATFLWAAQGKHAVGNLSGFSDVSAADWYATPVIWAKEQGITNGIGDGKFGPNDTCTRAQVVTFLNKVYG